MISKEEAATMVDSMGSGSDKPKRKKFSIMLKFVANCGIVCGIALALGGAMYYVKENDKAEAIENCYGKHRTSACFERKLKEVQAEEAYKKVLEGIRNG